LHLGKELEQFSTDQTAIFSDMSEFVSIVILQNAVTIRLLLLPMLTIVLGVKQVAKVK
jgi:hypothetical protein